MASESELVPRRLNEDRSEEFSDSGIQENLISGSVDGNQQEQDVRIVYGRRDETDSNQHESRIGVDPVIAQASDGKPPEIVESPDDLRSPRNHCDFDDIGIYSNEFQSTSSNLGTVATGSHQVGVAEMESKMRCLNVTESSQQQAILGSRSWKYDVFLCHAGENKPFVHLLYKELLDKYGIISFFDEESLEPGGVAQEDIANAMYQSRFFVTILSHEFKGKHFPEEEVDVALEFCVKNHRIIPVFYKITPDQCNANKSDCVVKLSKITGFKVEEKEKVSDEKLATDFAIKIGSLVKKEENHGTLQGPPEAVQFSDRYSDMNSFQPMKELKKKLQQQSPK